MFRWPNCQDSYCEENRFLACTMRIRPFSHVSAGEDLSHAQLSAPLNAIWPDLTPSRVALYLQGGCSSDDDTTWIQPMQWWDTATILRRNECSDCGQISPLHGLAHASLHSSVASPNMRAIWIDLWNPLYHRTATHPATSRFRAVSNCGRRLCDLTVQSV